MGGTLVLRYHQIEGGTHKQPGGDNTMITIYSTDGDRLYTDPKQRFYIDAELLREKARLTRTEYLLNQIAQRLGYKSFSELDTFLSCSGVTADVLESWILSGNIVQSFTSMVH